MLRLPSRLAAAIACFAPLFFQRSWRHAEVMLAGSALVREQRTGASIQRITGPARERRSVNYHRVRSIHARWARRRRPWPPPLPCRRLRQLSLPAPDGLVAKHEATPHRDLAEVTQSQVEAQ